MKKTISNFRTLAALLMAGAAFAACSSNDDNIIEQQPANPGEQVYTLTINASKGDGATTRALSLDGTKLVASWENGDVLTVVNQTKMDNLGGTLTASNASGNTATFSGSLTGTIADGDHLLLRYHYVDISDFGNQDGTLKGTNGAEKYDMAVAPVTVASVDVDGDNKTITTTDDASFMTATAMLKLTLQDNAATPNKLNATSLTISVDGVGDLWTYSPTAATYTATTNGNGVLYFALLDAEDGALWKSTTTAALEAATVTFTATVGGTTYVATKPGYKFAAGKYYQSTLTMAEVPSFTINAGGTKVLFAPGNLQATWNGTAWSWAFAANQWDYIGNAAGNTSINGNGTVDASNVTVDLFGWVGASSSWNDAPAKYGISNSTTLNSADNYGNVADEALKSDWGNTISDGYTWRTLTGGNDGEWRYILMTRNTGGTVFNTLHARYAHATINTDGTSVNGMILFPDGVDIASSEVTTAGTVNAGSDWGTKCTTAQWSALAAKGCVFLPAAGYRLGSEVYSVGSYGHYWSSSPYTSDVNYASCVAFHSNAVYDVGHAFRYEGFSVRLVRVVE